MKRSLLFSAIAIVLLLAGLIAVLAFNNMQKPFYVGVTFGGDNTSDAKLLIDKVKGYTNLFVLQSGPLQRNETAMDEIGDYAISSGLSYLVYSGVDNASDWSWWVDAAKQRWGNKFLGVYFDDEPGGKMLDSTVALGTSSSGIVTKITGGLISVINNGSSTINDWASIYYYADGTIRATKQDTSNSTEAGDIHQLKGNVTTYYPNGTITMQEIGGDFYTPENGSSIISQVEPYKDVLRAHPFPSCDAIAEKFVTMTHSNLEWLSNQPVTVLTSDYALYWWDYLSGYDVILAQLGWNNTVAQEIGLVRGAANLQGKDWGVMLTWKYTESSHHLASGEEIYSQMRTAYECGAKYVILFNYAEDMSGPYGTLQPEHFEALQRFWNEVVQNSSVPHGNVKADTVLVLPKNYGWGMRNPDDTIWGLWRPDDKSQQVWTQLQSALSAHGLHMDIVYDDPAYPVTGRYSQIQYWNQTD